LLRSGFFDKLYEWVTFARPAYDYLTAKQKALYDMVVPTIKSIAAGTRASTIIELDVDAVKAAGFVLDGTYTDENTDLNTNATATWTAIAADFEQVRKALIVDHPFEFYWCHGSGYGYTYSYGGGSYTVYPAFYFFPAENFQPASGYDEEAPTVDTVQTSAVNYAVTKANEIVTKYAGKTDIEKLTGYKDEICALVDYNHDALNGWSASEDNSPWQLLWVFDGDPDTKVVCEGYSKAFQYLCDLSTFDNAECYTVTGDCGGAHMWNIVKLDGKNYLVDVTNSDPDENDDGTVSVGADGSLFLKDPVAGGSVAQGYEFDTLATKNTKYTYGSDNIWGQDVLTLGAVAIVDDGNDVTYFQEFAKAAALWNSKNGSMLTLLNNCSSGQLYITGSNLILNLNKFTLTTTEKYYIFINVDGGSVSINGTGSIIGGSGAACLQNTKNGILTIVGDVTIGGQKKIDYTSGTIDLSRMANVEGLTIYASAAQSDMAKFILPEGYALCDASGNALDS